MRSDHQEIFGFDSPSIKGLSPNRQWIEQEENQLSLGFSAFQNKGSLEFPIYYSEQLSEEIEEPIPMKNQQMATEPPKLPKQIHLQSFNDQRAIREAIVMLVNFDTLPEIQLGNRVKEILSSSPFFDDIFSLLLPKFKKLKKTKEEIIKYCVRRAFRFATDIQEEESDTLAFSSVNAFIKNKRMKSMNSEFLRQLFSDKAFHRIYRRFLMEFHVFLEDDNTKKIDDFWRNICGILFGEGKQDKSTTTNSISLVKRRKLTYQEITGINDIKRMPWTKSVMQKTIEIAHELETYGMQSEMEIKENSSQLFN